jgi:dGTPase
MTDSLEVAHVGRFLGSEVIERFRKKGSLSELALDDKDTQHSFQTIIEIACLIHDLGNPPFGHFGEVAVARWFENGDRNLSHHDLPNFRGFDGNPQGFRIISRLAGADGKTGMNLTLTQLASTLKYPTQ